MPEPASGLRLFIAIDLPALVKDELEKLRVRMDGAVWVRREAFHLTLRFLGDGIAPPRAEAVRAALEAVNVPPFTMELQGTGRFPLILKQPPRVLWVGVEAPPPLRALHAQIETALASVDFPSDGEPFRPHVTLARLKGYRTAQEAPLWLRQKNHFASGPIAVREFHLMSSERQPGGMRYRSLQVYPLKDASAG